VIRTKRHSNTLVDFSPNQSLTLSINSRSRPFERIAQFIWLFFQRHTIVLLSLMPYFSNTLYNSRFKPSGICYAFHLCPHTYYIIYGADLRIRWCDFRSLSVITTDNIGCCRQNYQIIKEISFLKMILAFLGRFKLAINQIEIDS
jgi:hypothetical protein